MLKNGRAEHLDDRFDIGDAVMVDSYEGFGGPAKVIAVRDSPGGRYRVAMDDNNPPPFWAHDFELSPAGPPRDGYDSRPATREHIAHVRRLLGRVVDDMERRARQHDQSKLHSPEREAFDEWTPKLAATTYGSDEYKSYLHAMRPALEHHYAVNDHHPEYYALSGNGVDIDPNYLANGMAIRSMSLIQIIEMLVDWKAATLRHNDGDIRRSIEINQKRFGYGDELKQILLNTLPAIEG